MSTQVLCGLSTSGIWDAGAIPASTLIVVGQIADRYVPHKAQHRLGDDLPRDSTGLAEMPGKPAQDRVKSGQGAGGSSHRLNRIATPFATHREIHEQLTLSRRGVGSSPKEAFSPVTDTLQPSVFPSGNPCDPGDFLRSLNIESPEKQGISPLGAVLTRWKSQVRIPRRPCLSREKTTVTTTGTWREITGTMWGRRCAAERWYTAAVESMTHQARNLGGA